MLNDKGVKFRGHHLRHLLIVREVPVVDGAEVGIHDLIQRLLTGIPIHLSEGVIQVLVLAWSKIGRRRVSPTVRSRVTVLEGVLILDDLWSLTT